MPESSASTASADLVLFKQCVEVTDGVIASLERANANIEKMAETVDFTKQLVDAWVSICGKSRVANIKIQEQQRQEQEQFNEPVVEMPPPKPPPRKRAASVPAKRSTRQSTRKNARLR
jgi:hypothetical protein